MAKTAKADDEHRFLISAAARMVGNNCPEDWLRNLERRGVVSPIRDSAGRRLYSLQDVERARAHRAQTLRARPEA